LFFDQGYLGASVTSYQTDYGTVAEDAVHISMRKTRYDFEGLLRHPTEFLKDIKAQFSDQAYSHSELGPDSPSRYTNHGQQLRILASHQPWNWMGQKVEGQFGFQHDSQNFSAQGAEVFSPSSQTRKDAVFALQELKQSWGQYSLALRSENIQITPLEILNPGSASRHFTPLTSALGVTIEANSQWQLSAHWAAVQRAPTDVELFANGGHSALGAYEVGQPNLSLERSNQYDLGLKYKSEKDQLQTHFFLNNYANFIALNPRIQAGGQAYDVSSMLPIYDVSGVKARVQGFELSGRHRLESLKSVDAAANWLLSWRYDQVQGTNLNTQTPLARLPGQRLGLDLERQWASWEAQLGLDFSAAQNRVAELQNPSAAYALWHAGLNYRQTLSQQQWFWYARIDNITNHLAFPVTSVLTSTVVDASGQPRIPLPGRSLRAGLQIQF
jgi:iron complex outermembrane receptor protein